MPLFRKQHPTTTGHPHHQESSPSSSSLLLAGFRTSSSLAEDLRQAAWRGDNEQVLAMIKKAAKFTPNKDGRTALHLAAMKGHMTAVQLLVEHGCDLNCQDKLGYTAVHRAVLEGHGEIVRCLVDTNMVNVDKQDFVQENTPLHDAAWHGYNTIVESILSAKSNLYIRNKTGASALHLASQNGHSRSARLLIQRGCKPDVKDKYDDTPLHTSCRYIHAGVSRVLLAANANPNEQNKNGDTPLHLACNLSQKKVSRMLLDAGGKADVKNKQGETPIDIAVRKQLTDLVVVLKASLAAKQQAVPPKVTTEITPATNTNVINPASGKPSKSKIRERLQAAKDSGSTWQLLFQDWAPYGLDNNISSPPNPGPAGFSTNPNNNPAAQQRLSPPALMTNNNKSPPIMVEENNGAGEQQFCLDLRKGRVACHCAPFFYHLAKHNDEAHMELLEEIDACQNNLSNEISDLRQVTQRKIDHLNRAVKCVGRPAAAFANNGGRERSKLGWNKLLSTTKRRVYCTAGGGGVSASATPTAATNPNWPFLVWSSSGGSGSGGGRLIRSKSESEIETDIERGRGHRQLDGDDDDDSADDDDDDDDSASNASDDHESYLDNSGRRYLISSKNRRARINNHNHLCATISRRSAPTNRRGKVIVVDNDDERDDGELLSKRESPGKVLIRQESLLLDETVRRFDKLESSDSLQDSSTTTTTSGSCSATTTPTTTGHGQGQGQGHTSSVRSSIYSTSQSGYSSSQLSTSLLLSPNTTNNRSIQPSLDSGYDGSARMMNTMDQAAYCLDPAAMMMIGRQSLEPQKQQQRVRVEAETQTDAIQQSGMGNVRKPYYHHSTADCHEYTELECILRSSTTTNTKPPPILPIPPPPRKPLPPLPIESIQSSPPKRASIIRSNHHNHNHHQRSGNARYHPTNACLSTNV